MANESATGLSKNSAATLSVLLGPFIVIPVIFLILEKNKYVRFYALQSTLVFLLLVVFGKVLSYIPLVRDLGGLVLIVGFSLWLFMSIKAWGGEEWEVPVLGKLVRRFLS